MSITKNIGKIASFDVDAQNCFTPVCPEELPVPAGDEIITELNRQAMLADYRIGSKDAHSPHAIWVANEQRPQLSHLSDGHHADVYWKLHAVPGTKGFELIKGLPHPADYDYFVWKGIEPDMHPYGACYHDLAERQSTGVIEFFENHHISTVIVGGLATDYCVKTTVLQLLRAGFKVIVNLAACRGIFADSTKAAIALMQKNGAIIAKNCDELTKILPAQVRELNFPRKNTTNNIDPPIITSLLDTDLYKLTMMQCVLHQFAQATVEYRFKCRTPNVDITPYIDEIDREIDALCELRFQKEELEYLNTLDYITPNFTKFLGLFQLNRQFINVFVDNNELHITIEGPWLHTIMFEVPVLAIVNEVYFRNKYPKPNYDEGRRRLRDKIELIKMHPDKAQFVFSDFGTRRRFSKQWQREVIETLVKEIPQQLTGTSNIFFAKEFGVRPIGTMAHEFLQACQQLGPRLVDSQKFALETWVHEYRGRLGIALTDVINIDAFLRDFDLYFAKLFDGLRQDSGDPFEWGEKVITHYKNLKIDPKLKTLVFSDNLNVPKALALFERFKDRSHPAFGIGTNLTNDLGYEPIQIVIKMTRTNGYAVAKLSDTPEKSMCDDKSYVQRLQYLFQTNGTVPASDKTVPFPKKKKI